MTWIFWLSAAIIAYTYGGYAAWLWLRCRWRHKPIHPAAHTPFLSIVIVVRNEAEVLERKLQNLTELDYPSNLLEIVVISDGSTDQTEEILLPWSKQRGIRVFSRPEPRGKAAGLNDGIGIAKGEMVVFTDARQQIERDALRLLAENFADPQIGCASGELMLGDPQSGESNRGMGLYWQVEKFIREMESNSGSVVGATGALYAVRRELLVPVPPEVILDDVYLPMCVARQGFRVVFDPRARAWDSPDLGAEREFSRKVRTLSGNYQLVQLAPWMLTTSNPLRFEFISHKLLRLLAPFALVTTLVSSCFLPLPLNEAALALQIGFYLLGLLGVARIKPGPLGRVADACSTFVVLNTAAIIAFAKFVSGKKVAWGR